MEYAVSMKVLYVSEMDLVVCITASIPVGLNDMEITGNVGGTLLAKTEHPTRLAGKTIYRYARKCNPRELASARAQLWA